MAERCPLRQGLYWENEGQIPDFCLTNCGSLMDNAIDNFIVDGGYDMFADPDDSNCQHEAHTLETEDVSLQRGSGPRRIVGVTDNCVGCGEEYGAQSFYFECPND